MERLTFFEAVAVEMVPVSGVRVARKDYELGTPVNTTAMDWDCVRVTGKKAQKLRVADSVSVHLVNDDDLVVLIVVPVHAGALFVWSPVGLGPSVHAELGLAGSCGTGDDDGLGLEITLVGHYASVPVQPVEVAYHQPEELGSVDSNGLNTLSVVEIVLDGLEISSCACKSNFEKN